MSARLTNKHANTEGKRKKLLKCGIYLIIFNCSSNSWWKYSFMRRRIENVLFFTTIYKQWIPINMGRDYAKCIKILDRVQFHSRHSPSSMEILDLLYYDRVKLLVYFPPEAPPPSLPQTPFTRTIFICIFSVLLLKNPLLYFTPHDGTVEFTSFIGSSFQMVTSYSHHISLLVQL